MATTDAHLHAAVGCDRAADVSALLVVGADPCSSFVSGDTPLHIAAACGGATTLAALLSAHVGVDAVNAHGCAPLHIAVLRGCPVATAALLSAGADPDARVSLADATPSHGHPRRRFAARPSPCASDGLAASLRCAPMLGTTPLHLAASGTVARVLLAYGANANAPCAWG